MVKVMRLAPGVELAAPQIGIPLRIIVLEDTQEYISYVPEEETKAQDRRPFDLLVCGQGTKRFYGMCYSIVFMSCDLSCSSQWLSCFMGFPVAVFDGFRALVERSLEVEVTGLSRDGAPIKVEASGWQAGILQNSTNVIIWMERFMWIRWLKASERRSPVGPIPSTFT
ncbi:unnamed protein product [Linum tenue]|uniref:Peptide deformylase n=1 Tax=Linum tenue TaxID=586396 RepID=A0AAV0PTU8_9ROSI|nr:unnamed protein product [Linum tenue]